LAFMKSVGVRAAPMPAQQRRAAIIDAALPLLRRHGEGVTTKQIADAAGIAEGTIFRVFPDKESLITAAIAQVFDPGPTVDAMLGIDLSLPLRERLQAAIDIIAARLDSVWELMSAMRMMGAPEQNPRLRPALPAPQIDDVLPQALIALLEPDRHQFRVDPTQVARILRLVTFAGTHPRITDGNPLTSDEIIDLLMDGLRAHSPSPPGSCQPAVRALSEPFGTM
jgi:AcrR family transcriptional regulator